MYMYVCVNCCDLKAMVVDSSQQEDDDQPVPTLPTIHLTPPAPPSAKLDASSDGKACAGDKRKTDINGK